MDNSNNAHNATHRFHPHVWNGDGIGIALHCVAWRGVAWRGVGLHAGEPPSMEEEAAELFYELEQAVRLVGD